MTTRTPWSETDDQTLIELHATGVSLTAIARRMGRAQTTVAGNAKRLGLDWRVRDTSEQTAEARAARRERYQQGLDELREGLKEDMARLRDDLFKPVTVFNFGGKDNTYEEHELDEPTHGDKLKIVQAINSGIASMERLERMSQDNTNSDAVSMLDGLAAAIAATADTLRHQAELDELL